MNRRSAIALLGSLGLLAVSALYWPKRWRYIIIHHSGGAHGDIELLRRVHRERQPNDPMDEIPYHFLVGNGNGLQPGEVVETGRWRLQMWGAHVSDRNLDRNFRGIGICLIGDFERTQVPDMQFQAALVLTRSLMRRFRIPPERVTFHGKTPGEMTSCRGGTFKRAVSPSNFGSMISGRSRSISLVVR
jgi:N-acetylmuramoyl-L-alanine amidase